MECGLECGPWNVVHGLRQPAAAFIVGQPAGRQTINPGSYQRHSDHCSNPISVTGQTFPIGLPEFNFIFELVSDNPNGISKQSPKLA